MRRCKVDNCDRKHKANGFCGMHYMLDKRNGKPIRKRLYNNGRTKLPEYRIWFKIKERCYNKNCKSYKKSYMYNYTGSIMNHFCNNDKLCEWICSDKSDDQLIYEYDEHGTFFPGENFGCIHFEDKE